MLDKVLSNPSLGSKSQISYVLRVLNGPEVLLDDLQKLCLDYDYSCSSSFPGILEFLSWIGVIEIIKSRVVKLKTNLETPEASSLPILNKLSRALAEENQLHLFLNPSALSSNKQKGYIAIQKNFIPLKFFPVRNLLTNFGVFKKNTDLNEYIIDGEYYGWFQDYVIPLIEQSKIGNNPLKNLLEVQEKQADLGYQAEEFVLEYEKRNRKNHFRVENIKMISERDTSAGYDILSYIDDTSLVLNKYIEVKSYSGQITFFWSKNEIETAKKEQNHYFLYLVDRSRMKTAGYIPRIIQNPYEKIRQSQSWTQECVNWFITEPPEDKP